MSYDVVFGLSIREFDGGFVVAIKHDSSSVSPKDPYWSFLGKNGSLHFGRLDPAKSGYRIHGSPTTFEFEPFDTRADAEMYIIRSYALNDWQKGNNKYARAKEHAKPAHWHCSSFDYSLIHACKDIGFDEYADEISKRIEKRWDDYKAECVKNLMDALKEQKKQPKGKFIVRFTDPIYPKMKHLEVSYLAKISSQHIWMTDKQEKAKVYSDFQRAVSDAQRWVKHNHEHCGHTQFYAEIITPEGEVIKKVEYDKRGE